MGPLQKLETSLDEVLHKKAPFQLPVNGKRGLAYALWWIALVAGLLQLWAAWMFWHAAHTINKLVDFANSLSSVYGTTPFYGALINAVYGVVRIFSDYGGGIGSLIWALIGSVIGLYFLFQAREYFLPGASHTPPKADHKVTVEKTTEKTAK